MEEDYRWKKSAGRRIVKAARNQHTPPHHHRASILGQWASCKTQIDTTMYYLDTCVPIQLEFVIEDVITV